MGYHWRTCPSDLKDFTLKMKKGITEIINNDFLGFYLHGSLAMGGFNPKSSDIDVLVVTKNSVTVETKRKLAQFLLNCSNSPFPVEISFLTRDQLKSWQYPCPFDFHYSEFWRERYEDDLIRGASKYINGDINHDTDLAAHITIINYRGICVEGVPIDEISPSVPRSDYISSIMGDFQDCIENIEAHPIYCSLNLIRVYWYLKYGVIPSKQEAGNWGLKTFPQELRITISKVVDCYLNEKGNNKFEKNELLFIKNYIADRVQSLLC